MTPPDDKLAQQRGTTQANRGLAPKSGQTTPRVFHKHHATDFYDLNARYLGSWERRQRGWSIFLIQREKYDKIVKNRPNLPGGTASSEFAVSVPGDDPNDPNAGLSYQTRLNQIRVMVEQLVRAGRRLVVDPTGKQRRFLDAMLAEAKRTNKEQGAYIVLDYPKARLMLVKATVTRATAFDLTMAYGTYTIKGKRFLTPPPPAGNIGQQVVGTVHTHYLRDPDANKTQRGTRWGGDRMGYGVSDVDVAGAKKDQVLGYAVDHRYIHRANRDGTKSNRLTKKLNVAVDALELFGGKRPARR